MSNTEQLQSEHAYLIMLKALFDASADLASDVLARRIRQHPQFNSSATLEAFSLTHDFQYLEAFHNLRTVGVVSPNEQQLKGFDGLQLSGPASVEFEKFNAVQSILHDCFNSVCQEITRTILDKCQPREIPLELRQTYVITKLREKVLQLQSRLNALYKADTQQPELMAERIAAAQYATDDLLDHCREYCGVISKASALLQAIKVICEQVSKVKNQLTDLLAQLGHTNSCVAGITYQAVGFPYLMAKPGSAQDLLAQDYDAYTKRFVAVEQHQQQAAAAQQFEWQMRAENRHRSRFLARVGVTKAVKDSPLPPVPKLVL